MLGKCFSCRSKLCVSASWFCCSCQCLPKCKRPQDASTVHAANQAAPAVVRTAAASRSLRAANQTATAPTSLYAVNPSAAAAPTSLYAVNPRTQAASRSSCKSGRRRCHVLGELRVELVRTEFCPSASERRGPSDARFRAFPRLGARKDLPERTGTRGFARNWRIFPGPNSTATPNNGNYSSNSRFVIPGPDSCELISILSLPKPCVHPKRQACQSHGMRVELY